MVHVLDSFASTLTLQPVMGCNQPQSCGPCLNVLVLLFMHVYSLGRDLPVIFADYYYYATAGGARIWVRSTSYFCSMLRLLTLDFSGKNTLLLCRSCNS